MLEELNEKMTDSLNMFIAYVASQKNQEAKISNGELLEKMLLKQAALKIVIEENKQNYKRDEEEEINLEVLILEIKVFIDITEHLKNIS